MLCGVKSALYDRDCLGFGKVHSIMFSSEGVQRDEGLETGFDKLLLLKWTICPGEKSIVLRSRLFA